VPIRRQVGARRRTDGEARFRALVQHATDVIAVLDAAGAIRYTSPAVASVLGYRPEERLVGSAFDLIHPDDAPGARQALARLLHASDLIERLALRLRHLEVTAKNLLRDPAVGGIVVNYRDVTARQESEAALRRQHAHLAALHDTALALLPPRPAPADLLGDIVARAGALVGTPDGYIYLLAPGDDAMTVRVGVGIFRDGVGNRPPPGDRRLRRVAGAQARHGARPVPRHRGGAAHRGGAVVGVIGLAHVAPGHHFGAEELAILGRFGALASLALEHARLHDAARRELAEREIAEIRLAHQATHDPLTGLSNRAHFQERLGDALARARPDGPPCGP
jgi:PAS domain S-box-containing protein